MKKKFMVVLGTQLKEWDDEAANQPLFFREGREDSFEKRKAEPNPDENYSVNIYKERNDDYAIIANQIHTLAQ